MTYSDQIMELIKDLQADELPDDIVYAIKDCIIDYLGVTLAGSYELKDKLINYIDTKPCESRTVKVIGLERGCGSIEDAALLNGMAAHYFELDDGSRFGMVHLGATILSALFAAAKPFNISRESFIRAAFVGYEITARLASAVQPGHKKRGFHTTGTCGCIGAAAAIGTALDYDEQSMRNTISAAVASAAGLLEMIEDISQLKPFNAGKAAQNAVTAALIGKAGFSGPFDPVGGKRGFLHVMTDGLKDEWLSRDGDKKYAVKSIYKKPYASCRHCHPSVEAALKLTENVMPDQIDHIDIYTYDLAVFGHDHTIISGPGSAKMSIPYSVASAVYLKNGGLETMSEKVLYNEDILDLAKRIHVFENDEYSALVPGKRIAEMIIHLKDGNKHVQKVVYPKGEPENPMSRDEIVDKFKQMAVYAGKDDVYCSDMIDAVYNIENSFDELIEIM